MKPIKPLFMWTGGKGKVIPKLYERGLLPSYQQFDAYVEPFFGGGAIFCDVVNSGFTKEYVINDLNMEMMFVYYWIREKPGAFIAECERLLEERNRLTPRGRNKWYTSLREAYWNMPDLKLYTTRKPATLKTAATLYVLMLTGFNGLWQVKKCKNPKWNGKYGAAAGFLDKEFTVNAELIRAWSKVLARARLFSGSYQDIEITQGNALIYVDPPYRGSIQMYGRSFTDPDQAELVQWCIDKTLQNHTVIFSNRDLGDNFFRALFREDEDAYHHFAHNYLKGTKAHELVVVLEPERLKRQQILIDGQVVTFPVRYLTKMLRRNPIVSKYGVTVRGLFESSRRPKR